MSDATTDKPPAATPSSNAPKRWFRPASGPRLSPEEAKREGHVIRLALDGFGAQAMTFLNTVDESIDGAPLAVATRSAEGAAAVERLIAEKRGATG